MLCSLARDWPKDHSRWTDSVCFAVSRTHRYCIDLSLNSNSFLWLYHAWAGLFLLKLLGPGVFWYHFWNMYPWFCLPYLASILLYFSNLRALTHWLDFTLKAKLSWTNKQLMPKQWWQNCVQEKSSTLFLGRFCGWKAWEEAGSQCGCRGDGRRRKELEQTEGKWVWWALPPIN